MAVGNDKDRIIVTTTKELKEQLQKLAKQDDRTLSNFINQILKQYVESNK
ncbi:DNA-binding protein [uncultured Clostridium sp.]|nr:DNA-binding protein [uncultured Clostridium sp.]